MLETYSDDYFMFSILEHTLKTIIQNWYFKEQPVLQSVLVIFVYIRFFKLVVYTIFYRIRNCILCVWYIFIAVQMSCWLLLVKHSCWQPCPHHVTPRLLNNLLTQSKANITHNSSYHGVRDCQLLFIVLYFNFFNLFITMVTQKNKVIYMYTEQHRAFSFSLYMYSLSQ